MYRFWKPIIEPIFSILKPRVVVEIGSDHGNNTKNLLEYCQKYDATLHSIDPLPKFDVSKWSEKYEDAAVFHVELSLNALPKINRIDAVLIDGDHNWYTVFHELKLIEKSAKRSKHPFPLVLLHDIGWPYGRRDLYYNPDNIPEAYRKPYKKLGIKPGNAELAEQGGLNPHLYNGIYENDLQNGVLTAVEDFLEDTELALDFIKIPVISGLGILFPRDMKVKHPEIAVFVENLSIPPTIQVLIEQVENARIDSEVGRHEMGKVRDKDIAELKAHISESERRQGITEQELTRLKSDISTTEMLLLEKDEKIADLTERLATAEQQDATAEEEIKRLKSELESLKNTSREKNESIRNITQRLANKEVELGAAKKDLQLLQSDILDKSRHMSRNIAILKQQKKDIDKLTWWIQKLDQDIEGLRGSWRWKIGNALIRGAEMVMLRKRVPLAINRMIQVTGDFKGWIDKRSKHAAADLLSEERHIPSSQKADKKKPHNSVDLEPVCYPSTKNNGLNSGYSVTSFPSVGIVVCVHNALTHVKKCLHSVVTNTTVDYTLYIVNDGSDPKTSDFLTLFSKGHPRCTLLKNASREGYSKAANKGLRATIADYVILLNSDCIVSKNWVHNLIQCGESDDNIGIIGPLSNAASWQSVPRLYDKNGAFAINQLTKQLSVDKMAAIVESISEKRFPRVPLINGFCFAIKRSVIQKIGFFDEEAFPHGYGEEDDYCIRALNAKFTAVVADNTYVFHAKTKSYGHANRIELSKAGAAVLRKKHGTQRLTNDINKMKSDLSLEAIRSAIQEHVEKNSHTLRPAKNKSLLHKCFYKQDQLLKAREYDEFISRIETKPTHDRECSISARVIIIPRQNDQSSNLAPSLLSIPKAGDVSITILDSKNIHDKCYENLTHIPVDKESDIPGQLNEIFANIDEEFVLLLPAGDLIAPGAFGKLFEHLAGHSSSRPKIGAIVFDDDEITENGERVNPSFKPSFSPDLFIEHDYIGCSVWLNRLNVLHVGGFNTRYKREYLRDLLFRLFEADTKIEKIDYICCHRRSKMIGEYPSEEHRQMIEDTLIRKNGYFDKAVRLPTGFRPQFRIPASPVSIIIPFRDNVDYLKRCVDSIERLTSEIEYELILVNNNSSSPETIDYLRGISEKPQVRIIEYNQSFNYSKINNFAVTFARGEILVFLNNDTEVISTRWLHELAGDAQRSEIGAVGGLLFYPNGTIQHAGVIIGLNGLAGHLFAGEDEAFVPRELIRYRRNTSAVTAACMAIRRLVFEQIGGFNEEFEITGSDVDICLRLLKKGYRNLVNPEVRLIHYEKATRKRIRVKDIDIQMSLQNYMPFLDQGDPYYNPSLSLNCSGLKLNFNERPIHLRYRVKSSNTEKTVIPFSGSKRKNRTLYLNKAIDFISRYKKPELVDDEVIMYDVTPDELEKNRKVVEQFLENPPQKLQRALWFVPHFDHVYRGGLYTIFRVAQFLSQRAGITNVIVLYGRAKRTFEELKSVLATVFPKLRFELIQLGTNMDVSSLPETDISFCTLWNSSYLLVRYNKCRGKFFFVQDLESSFYPAGSVFGLIEQAFRFGFVGIANTPGVAEAYSKYNERVGYFIPGVDRSVFYPPENRQDQSRPYRIVFYGRPQNARNAFRLGVEACRIVKEHFGDQVQIISVGAEYSISDYGLDGIIENYGVLSSFEEVADLYRSSDLGLIFMFTAHPSYQPFEYMASGCVTVTNYSPWNRWFFRNNENAILTEPTVSCTASRIIEVLEDSRLKQKVMQGGLTTVAGMDWDSALEKIYHIVRNPEKYTWSANT